MASRTIEVGSTAEAYLALLAARGVEYLFGNAGTDFAPVIEAYAASEAAGRAVPRPITVPHENAAVAMAHGYAMVTGRPQAVMTHVSVGSANAINGIFNAARARVPILVTAGRTPLTEGTALRGSRDFSIHWAQEMFDQGGMMRELVKWDYELRNRVQLEAVVDRALELATAQPQGPIYLSLPREVLGEEAEAFSYEDPPRRDPGAPIGPNPDALARAAACLAAAERPLIIASSSGRHPETVSVLGDLAERYGLAVVESGAKYLCLPTSHPMHVGGAPGPWLAEADAVLVIDCDVPWSLGHEDPPAGCTVIHLGVDPIYPDYPIHSFPRDITIPADPRVALPLLADALAQASRDKEPAIDTRRQRAHGNHDAALAEAAAQLESVRHESPIHPLWLSHCLGEVLEEDSIVVNEYPLMVGQLGLSQPGSYFGLSPAGGLGWGFGAALGAKLAAPDKLVAVGLGDGAYMFSNPTPCHWVSATEGLPVLTVVRNNQRWGAVQAAAARMYPEGRWVRQEHRPLIDLTPSPAFELVAQASGAHAERVEDPAALPDALERAVRAVQEEGRQALLNVIAG